MTRPDIAVAAEITFCKCGLPLIDNRCKRESWEDHKREPRVRQERYSGFSKRYRGAYERY